MILVKYYKSNDSILAEKIYITYEKQKSKPIKLQTKGRHNAQQLTIMGNPATATIVKPLKWVKE